MRWDEVTWGEKKSDFLRWDEVWNVKCKCEAWSAGCEGWSVKKVFAWRCIAMWSGARHVLGCSWTTTVQQVRAKHAFTNGPGWRTVLASSIGAKGLVIKSKATSAPPRAGTTGMELFKHMYMYILYIYVYYIYILYIIYLNTIHYNTLLNS